MTDINLPQPALRAPHTSTPSPSPPALDTQCLTIPTKLPVLHKPSSNTNKHQNITKPLPELDTSTATPQPEHTSTGSSTPSSTNSALKSPQNVLTYDYPGTKGHAEKHDLMETMYS